MEIDGSIEVIFDSKFYYGCYSRYINLKKLVIKEGVKSINNFSFTNLKNLEAVILPNSLKNIGEYVFSVCPNLDYIYFSSIPDFGYNDLKCRNLIFSSNILESGQFKQLIDFIKDNICHFSTIKCKKITIEYNNYEQLYNLIDSINKLDDLKYKILLLEFQGKKLTFFEKLTLKHLIDKDKLEEVLYFNTNNKSKTVVNSIEEKKDENGSYQFDDEIKQLIDKINKAILILPESSKQFFQAEIEKLTKKYFDELNKEKPNFNLNDQNNMINLELNDSSIGSARINFIIGLNNIINNLSNQQKELELLSLLKNYNEIINQKYDNIIENPTKIEDYLINISFIASNIDYQSGNKLLKEIKDLINDLKEKYENDIKKDINNENDIVLKLQGDPVKELNLNIIDKYNKYYLYYVKITKFIKLKNSLNNLNAIDEYSEENDISGTLNNITYLLNLINDAVLKTKFKLLKANYLTIINDLIDKQEIDGYNELEKKLRKELVPIIEEIQKINNVEINIKKLKNELKEQLAKSDNIKLSVINSFVEEINNLCIENNVPLEIVNNINNQIRDILKRGQEKLKTIKLNNEVDELEKEIYGSLADIELKLKIYIKNINNYNELYHKK